MKRDFKRRLGKLVTVVGLTGLLITGCGSSNTANTSEEAAQSSNTVSTTEGSDKEETKDSEKTASSIINYGLSTAWDTLNPYDSASGSMYSQVVWDKIYDRLAFTSQAGEVLEPRAASSWESTDDGKSILFHLNKNATWHDGESVTAYDWVYTVQLISDPDCVLNNGNFFNFLEGTDDLGKATAEGSVKAEALDDYTLKLTFKNAIDPNDFLVLYNRNFYVLPKHILESYASGEIKDIDFWKAPVGSGPCIFESEIVGNQLILESNKDYYLGTPGFDKLAINVIDSANILSSFISGELDYFAFGNALNNVDDKQVAEQAGFTVNDSKTKSNFVEVILNNTNIPDSKVRLAMNYALDKKILAESSTQGLGSPSTSYVLPGSEYYNTDLTVDRDVEKAKALLAEAGYDSSKVYTMAIAQSRASLAALIQQEWAEVGINVEIITVDVATMFTGLTEGKYDIGISGHQATAYPLWFSSNFSNAVSNNFGITESLYDDWKNNILEEKDADKKKQLIWDYQQFVFEKAPFIPLWHSGSLIIESKTIQNIDYEAAGMCNDNVWEWTKNN